MLKCWQRRRGLLPSVEFTDSDFQVFRHSCFHTSTSCLSFWYVIPLLQTRHYTELKNYTICVTAFKNLEGAPPISFFSILLPNIVGVVKSRRMRWAGHVARMGERRVVYRVLVGKPKGKRPLGRPRRRWKDNIKMDLQEVGGGCWDWMELAQDRDRSRAHVSTMRNLRVPKMRGISWLAAEPVSFSRKTLLHGVSK